MTGAMRVDAAGLRHAEPVIGAVASGVRQALDELSASLEGEGACWGHDRFGQQFNDVYATPADMTRDAFAALHDGLCAVAGAVLRVADEVDAVEDRVRLRLR